MSFSKIIPLAFVVFFGLGFETGHALSVVPNTNTTRQVKMFANPILDELAGDPCILKHNGWYYMVFTQGDRIDILKSPILSNFRDAERATIYRAPPFRHNLWAPELHLIRGGLYIYFTMDDGVADEMHRMYVIQAVDSNNPMGQWNTEIRLLPEEEIYAIDGTVMQYGDGELYFIWTGFPNLPPTSMNLYIAKMSSPTQVIAPRILLRTPSMDWETHGFPVNEGPWILNRGGRTFLIFSASSTFTPDYCLGIMGIDDLRDPLIVGNWWNDVNECVFKRNDAENVFTTGHASFVNSIDDSEVWMVYHATDDVNDNGRNRRARIQKLDFFPDHAPFFPLAIGSGRLIPAPSGEL